MNKIALHTYQLGGRGTEVCLYKYAKYIKEYLNLEPIIVSTSTRPAPTLERFKKDFKTYLYPYDWKPDGENFQIRNYFNELIITENIDFFYSMKGGEDDGILKNLYCKTGAHAVFRMDQRHGDVYAGISNYLSKKNNKNFPYVDYVVDYKRLEENINLRHELSIPKNALVGVRHGGSDTFNLNFAYNSIFNALEKRNDLWFIFLNTNKFIDHPRVIFLPWSGDMNYILKFVNTGDFFIHARYDGETFGLACAEASTQNKPVVTWKPDNIPEHYDTAHIDLLGEKAIYYKNSQELYDILINLNKYELLKSDWNAYGTKCSPQKVMNQFKDVFLQG